MWLPDRARLIKVRLCSNGEDVETPWAEDGGPAPSPAGAHYVRLGNVPFLHARPTYADVIVGVPDEDGMLTWDSGGLPYERIGERIIEDSGRWVMILDYRVLDDGDAQEAFNALDVAGEKSDIAVEGCYGPKGDRPGRPYLAVPPQLTVETVLAYLDGQTVIRAVTATALHFDLSHLLRFDGVWSSMVRGRIHDASGIRARSGCFLVHLRSYMLGNAVRSLASSDCGAGAAAVAPRFCVAKDFPTRAMSRTSSG